MDFLEAVKAMKKGNKVRRTEWAEDTYIYIRDTLIRDHRSVFVTLDTTRIEATDWELFGEKTLSDKQCKSNGSYWIKKEDVKEALNKLIESFNKDSLYRKTIKDKAKEIFGEGLLK